MSRRRCWAPASVRRGQAYLQNQIAERRFLVQSEETQVGAQADGLFFAPSDRDLKQIEGPLLVAE